MSPPLQKDCNERLHQKTKKTQQLIWCQVPFSEENVLVMDEIRKMKGQQVNFYRPISHKIMMIMQKIIVELQFIGTLTKYNLKTHQ